MSDYTIVAGRATIDKDPEASLLYGINVADIIEPGDTLTVKAKGPDNHEVEGIRNTDLTVTFKVDRIDRIIAATAAQMAASIVPCLADRVLGGGHLLGRFWGWSFF
jgi:hypothetical protein